jgi:ribose transport system substrate-binding protein
MLAPTAAAAVPELPDGLPCPTGGKAWKIGVLHVGDCPYCSGLLASYKEEAALLGVQATILDGQLKSDLQAQQLDQLIAQKPDIIVAVPVNTKALIPGLARAQAAGIPVVDATIKVDPAGEQFVVGYVGIDDIMAGKLSADLMIKAINGKGKIVIVAGQPGGSEVLRTKGFKDEIAAAAPGITIGTVQYTDFTKENALAVTHSLLAKYPDLNGIWGEDDTISSGIAQAVSDVGKTAQIQIIGMNGNKAGCTAIQNGQMYGTIVQQPYVDGAWSLIYAVDVLEGHQPGKFIPLSQPEITKANIADWAPKCW